MPVALFALLADYCLYAYLLQACIKPQYVDQIPKAVKGTVQGMLDKKDELHIQEQICSQFGKFTPMIISDQFICLSWNIFPQQYSLASLGIIGASNPSVDISIFCLLPLYQLSDHRG